MIGDWRLRRAVYHLARGGVIGYPTESIFGLGCDPLNAAAVARIYHLKRRPRERGVILIAATREQLTPWIAPLEPARMAAILDSWPGPDTWVLPASAATPPWLRSAEGTLAVRVTAHPLAAALCRSWGGALISTSANLSGGTPAKHPWQARLIFGHRLDYLLAGATGGRASPSRIWHGATGERLR